MALRRVVGGRFNTETLEGFGAWRPPLDVVTAYTSLTSYRDMMEETWTISVWDGFLGKLSLALPLLPDSGEGSFTSIAAGEQDDVWRKVAQNLKAHGRGDSIVRVGWESNLKDWRWQVTSSNVTEFKAAYRQIVRTMRAETPELRFEFGITCGASIAGSSDRLASLTTVYPGDDVVDLIGCDTYDWWNTHATDDATWQKVSQAGGWPGNPGRRRFRTRAQ